MRTEEENVDHSKFWVVNAV